MAVRRRYKSGGRVPVEPVNVAIDADVPSRSPSPAPSPESDAVIRAAQATLRAEEMQRAAQMQAQQPLTVEQVIERLDLSEHKKSFLRQNQHFVLDPQQQELMRAAYAEAMQAGVPDDSEQMNRAVLDGVAARQERARQQRELASTPLRFDEPAPAPTRPAPPPAARPEPVLHRELAPPEIKRRMPITAIPSRDVPTASGQRMVSPGKITLTAEQRIIARNSFSAPGMTDQEKELLYARNLQKLQQMRANGSYTE